MQQHLYDGPMDKREIEWKLLLHQIGLDVARTDRTLMFYEKQENLSKLWDILSVYAWFDADVGYCQGMSDLCSPMIMLLDNEADAFWCFERLMKKLVPLVFFYIQIQYSVRLIFPDTSRSCKEREFQMHGQVGRRGVSAL